MNSKVIYTTVFLTASLTIVAVNYSVFNPENQVDLVGKNESTYNAEAYESTNDQSTWDKVMNVFKKDVEPEIELEKTDVSVLNTDVDNLTDDDLIDLFGAKAYDEKGDLLPISVSKSAKSDTLIIVTFTAETEQETIKSIDGNLQIMFNSRPKLTLKDRKIKISLRKYNRYSDEELTKYIIRKAGIKCEDVEDGKIEPTIDLSSINAENGEYKLKVTAADSDEQESSIDVILRIT